MIARLRIVDGTVFRRSLMLFPRLLLISVLIGVTYAGITARGLSDPWAFGLTAVLAVVCVLAFTRTPVKVNNRYAQSELSVQVIGKAQKRVVVVKITDGSMKDEFVLHIRTTKPAHLETIQNMTAEQWREIVAEVRQLREKGPQSECAELQSHKRKRSVGYIHKKETGLLEPISGVKTWIVGFSQLSAILGEARNPAPR